MKKTKTQKTLTILIISVLSISALLVVAPAISGQDLERKTTYATCGLLPNPVGVGQQVLIWIGITDYLATQTHGWEGLTVTVTDPSGNTETLGPYRTDATGSTGAVYTPTQVGTYTFQTHFPEQSYTWNEAPIFDPGLLGRTIIYEASESDIVELLVQEEPIEYYPGHSLPNEYWTRPIDAQLWEWSSVSGNWVTTPPNMFAPYNDDAPETPHILWSQQLVTGGLVGGAFGNHAYDCGDAYEGKFLTTGSDSSIIMAGKLFFNRHQARGDSLIEKEVVAVDIRTGEELWSRTLGNNETLAFGQIFYWDSYNMHSSFEYLWTTDGTVDIYVFGNKVADGVRPALGNTWKAFDPFTGRWVYTMENVPSGSMLRGSNGEILIYSIDVDAGWLSLWNSSRVVSDHGSWRPHGQTFDATKGIEWNVTLPSGLPSVPARSTPIVLEDRIIGSTATLFQQKTEDTPVTSWGISLKPGNEGDLLFKTVWQPPPGDLSVGLSAASVEDGIFTIWSKEERASYGFDINTGEYVWGPTPSQAQLDIFGIENYIAYGKLFSVGMSGIVYCYDVKTGQPEWNYPADDVFSEILWSNDWPLHVAFITDGKIYLTHSEHSVIDPKPRGAPFICLDVETGQEVWRVDGAFRGTDWGGNAIIGDSIIATYNTYDGQMYAIGKGPTETTVQGPTTVVPKGTNVLLQGTVMDVSEGTKHSSLTARFPNGVPAVADADMGDWMKYVYMQFERPADVQGVTVTIEAVDPNGNYQNLGTTTTDSSGNYGFMFEPEVEGTYMIIATFMGSKAYWSSTTTTYVGIGPTSSASTPIEPDEATEAIISTELITILAVIVAVVVGLVTYWVLRKRV